jgi:hypothetical protein
VLSGAKSQGPGAKGQGWRAWRAAPWPNRVRGKRGSKRVKERRGREERIEERGDGREGRGEMMDEGRGESIGPADTVRQRRDGVIPVWVGGEMMTGASGNSRDEIGLVYVALHYSRRNCISMCSIALVEMKLYLHV